MVLRRLAHPDDERLGPPLRVVVTTVRSLLQPMAPDLADIEPVTLTLGEEADFDGVIAPAGRAGLHPRRHGRQAGRVRGARRDPRRVPADRRTPGACRVLGRRGLRDADVLGRRPALDPRHRRRHRDRGAVPRAAADRRRPACAPSSSRPTTRDRQPTCPAACPTCWPSSARASPSTAWRRCCRCCGPTELSLLSDHLPAQHAAADLRPREGPHPGRRPDQDRPGVPRGVVVDGGGRRRRAHRPRGARRVGFPGLDDVARGGRGRAGTRGGR